MKVVAADQPRSSRRYALLLAARDSEYVLKAYGGYFNVFVSAFGCGYEGDAGEESWDLFRAVDGELPTEKDLDGYDGFVISGSPYDAYADERWILRLCLLVQDLVAARKRLLGICFGHQVICRALGGRVGKARVGGWDIGIREVTMAATLPPCRFLDALQDLPPNAKITECHQDEVWEAPLGAEVLASSDKTGVEMFCVGDHVLGIQGHPEYTADILLSLVDRLSSAQSITVSFAEGVKRQLEATGPDREFWLTLCKSFLKTQELP
ncbi:gamma-glutamyl peptidase 3 [Lolium perenne]|uniref:gamma-glutamyl peptidase 3 n=1 Tax=Lolium perenne TaxID=4522 RepID=UPI0021F6575D|nr:gamma-glutamyl peptidase 3-like [Lolium perenne]